MSERIISALRSANQQNPLIVSYTFSYIEAYRKRYIGNVYMRKPETILSLKVEILDGDTLVYSYEGCSPALMAKRVLTIPFITEQQKASYRAGVYNGLYKLSKNPNKIIKPHTFTIGGRDIRLSVA